jgi:hypothetical protein
MTDQWAENLRCYTCTNTGTTTLSQSDGNRTPTVLSVPDGFKVVQTEYGPDFHCEACNTRAEPEAAMWPPSEGVVGAVE